MRIALAWVAAVAILLNLGGFSTAAFAEDSEATVTSHGLIFVLDEAQGTAEVKTRADEALEVNIPETVTAHGQVFTVTSIGWGAFHSAGLTAATMPDTITKIDVGAFYLNNIDHIRLSSSLTVIERQAFREAGLKSLSLPEGLREIASSAFYENEIGALEMPSSVQSIGERSFENAGITSLDLPEGLTEIPDFAFRGNQITTLTLPDSVTTLGTHAFIFSPLTSLTLPPALTTIGWNAFYGHKLTEVTIPASVTTIEKFAFAGEPEHQRTIHFEGNAPTMSPGYDFGRPLGSPDKVQVTYLAGAAGFTTPTWQGYEAVPLSTTVTFDTRDGSTVSPATVPVGTAIAVPTPPTRSAYSFTGWYVDETTTERYDFDSLVSGPLTLYAGWEVSAYTVTWDENHADADTPETVVSSEKTLGNLPEPSADGMVIREWNTQADGSGTQVSEDTLLSSITSGTEATLYAIWDTRTLALTFAPESSAVSTATAGDTVDVQATANAAFGGTVDVSHEVVITSTSENDVVTKSQVRVKTAGTRTLTGAFDGATATATLDVVAGPLGTLTLTPTEDVSAQGSSVEFTVTGADAEGNAVVIDPANVTLTSAVASDVVTGMNVHFPTAGTRQITASVAGAGAPPVTIDVTVSPRYVVTWDENWKDAGTPETQVVTADRLPDLPDPSAAGWVITGWNTAVDGSGAFVNTDTQLATVATGAEVTLYAIWEKRVLVLIPSTHSPVAGGTVDIAATANAPFGGTVDVSAEVALASSEASDRVAGPTVSVFEAGARTLTGTFDGATASVTIEVNGNTTTPGGALPGGHTETASQLPETGSIPPLLAGLTALVLLLAGSALVLSRRRQAVRLSLD